MTVFVGDFRGTLDLRGDAVRAVHVGAALNPSIAGGIERDDTVPDTISELDAFADTRIYDYVAKAYRGSLDAVGFMQYRRGFALGTDADDASSPVGRLYHAAKRRDTGEIKISEAELSAYHAHLSRLSRQAIFSVLDDVDIVVNRHDFGHMSVEEQFLRSTSRLYPQQTEYLECWTAMKQAMARLIGRDAVETYLSSNYAFLNNCFIARWDEFERYQAFLFAITSDLRAWHGLYRVFGYQAERIFTAYVRHQSDSRTGYRIRTMSMLAATGPAPGPAMLAMRRLCDDRSLSLDLEGFAVRLEGDRAHDEAIVFGQTVLSVRLDDARPDVTIRATLRGTLPAHFSTRLSNGGNRPATLTVREEGGDTRHVEVAPCPAPHAQSCTLSYDRDHLGHEASVHLTFTLDDRGAHHGGLAIIMLDEFRLGLTPSDA